MFQNVEFCSEYLALLGYLRMVFIIHVVLAYLRTVVAKYN